VIYHEHLLSQIVLVNVNRGEFLLVGTGVHVKVGTHHVADELLGSQGNWISLIIHHFEFYTLIFVGTNPSINTYFP